MNKQTIDNSAFGKKAPAFATLVIFLSTAATASISVYDLEVQPTEPGVGQDVTITFNAQATGEDTVADMMAKWPGTGYSENSIFCGASWCTSDSKFSWTYTPQSSGEKTIDVKASNYGGTATDHDSTTIDVQTSGQQPIAAFTYYPEDIEVGETVTFNAYCSGETDLYCARDPDGGSIQTYLWDLNGDGDFYDSVDDTGGVASRDFDSPGTQTVGLKVQDDEGQWSEPYELDIEVDEASNQAPTADFKYHPQSPEVDETVFLDASCDTGTPCASDPDGNIDTYLWDLNGDGDYYDSVDATGSTASVSFDSSGSHTVGLKVKDNDGAWDEKTKEITVEQEDNQAPEADFKVSPQNPEPGATVTFNAGCSTGTPCATDPDGSITSYMWDFDEDGDYDDATGALATESFQSDTDVSLKVEDDDGATDTRTRTVSVSDFSIVDYGPSGDVQSPVELFVELDNNPSEGGCKWESGYSVQRSTSTLMSKPDSSEPQWTLSEDFSEGFHRVTFQCFNSNAELTGEETTTFTIDDEQDNEPTARFSWDDHHVVVGESVQFDASASSDPDNDIHEYRWSFGDGTGYEYGEVESHTFSSTGTYDVELRVEDSKGNTDFQTKTVTVEEQPGECRVNVGQLNLGDDFIEEGSSTTASVTLSNNGDEAQQFEVKFKVSGDTVKTIHRTLSAGSSSTFSTSITPDQDSLVTAKVKTEGDPCGDHTFYRYDNIDVYPEDDDGEEGEEDREPKASFTWSPGQPYPDETVTFNASSSSDPDNDIVDYTWYFGDGTSSNGRTVDHIFSSTGDYSVQLVVEDSQGNTDAQVRTVPVVKDPEACSYQVSGIRFGDDFIERGTSTSASVTVSNLGERQAFEVKFTDSGDHVETENVVVAANSQRTVSTTISPDKDSLIGAKVITDGDPCGQTEKQKYKEIDVYSGEQEQDPTLDVNVYDRDGRRLYNARVNLDGPTSLTRYTDSGGEAFFQLKEGNYDLTVSKSGYSTEKRTLNLEKGDNSVITVSLAQQQQEGTLLALVEDSDGKRLSDAEVTAENGETKIRDTGNNGIAVMNLQEGKYTVTAEKSGYGSRTKTVEIEEGQQTTEVFKLFDSGEGLQITDVQSPSSVCRGDTMAAQVTIENKGGYHEVVSLTGSGLGGITAIGSFSLEAGETVTKMLYFTNVQGSGSEQFKVTVNNQNDYKTQRSVQVDSCGTTGGGQASDISLAIDYTKTPKMAVAGDFIKVSGFVDGATGRSNVEISVDDEVKATVRTQPDGYYQTWITAEDVGPHTVTASTGDVSDSKPLRIIPTSDVSNLRAPVSQFEGQTFQICATVESQIEPEVVLVRDGQIVQSKKQSGEVCFELEAREPGMHQYKVAALTSGRSNTATTTVEVLEMGVEASSFPNQIASVESGSGLVKVDLYNTNDGQTRYDLALEGLPGTWVSQSEKQVVLDKGERRTVYFYLTPQEEGSYRPTIAVDSRGTEIYSEELSVITGGTTDSNPKEEEDQEGFFGQVWKGVTGFLSF